MGMLGIKISEERKRAVAPVLRAFLERGWTVTFGGFGDSLANLGKPLLGYRHPSSDSSEIREQMFALMDQYQEELLAWTDDPWPLSENPPPLPPLTQGQTGR